MKRGVKTMLNKQRVFAGLCVLINLVFVGPAFGQASAPKKVFMVTDMEGVSGIFDSDLQCWPGRSRRFEESRKLLTGEITTRRWMAYSPAGGANGGHCV